MRRLLGLALAAAPGVLACASDEGAGAAGSGGDATSAGSDAAGSSAASGGGNRTGTAGADAGGGAGGSPQHPPDPCEGYADRETCCADEACGWHHNTGHALYGVPPCVSSERVCEAGGRTVRECPEGMICLNEGASQETEDDCTLPPDTQAYLPGRGICVWR